MKVTSKSYKGERLIELSSYVDDLNKILGKGWQWVISEHEDPSGDDLRIMYDGVEYDLNAHFEPDMTAEEAKEAARNLFSVLRTAAENSKDRDFEFEIIPE